MKTIQVRDITISNDRPFTLIAGPCAMESREHALMMQEEIGNITSKLGIPFIFKTSFDKANRTSVDSPRGVGIGDAVLVFEELGKNTPVLTDVHEPYQCDILKDVVDVLQIPAFLCRQTDLLVAAGNTGLAVNVKKGQFVAPEDMANVIKKIESTGNHNIILTERGTFFGYGNLVVDYRGLEIMKETGYPVCMDATHAVQKPSGLGGVSGGDRKYVPVMAKAGLVQGIGALFTEVHDNPEEAFSDGPNMIRLSDLEEFLVQMKRIDEVGKSK